MRAVFVPAVAVHSLFSLCVFVGLFAHAWMNVPGWMPLVGTLAWLALGVMIAAPALVLGIIVLPDPGRPRFLRESIAELRRKASRRMKRMMAVLAFTFLAGGFLIAGAGLFFPRVPDLRLVGMSLTGCSVALFFIVTPWIALYSRWFDVDPN